MDRQRLLLASLLVAIVLAAPQPGAAQGALGAYVRVATWEETATAIPPRVWNQPAGINLTPSGKVFVTDSRLRRVEVLDADGQALLDFGRGASAQDLVAPGHVAVDEVRDRVYVADPGAGRIAVYSLNGARVALWPGIGGPAGVAVAPDGRVVVSDTSGDRVRVFAPDGTETGGWGGTGTGAMQLDYPAGVHVTADGAVWVSDRGNGRVVVATLDGQPVDVVRLNAPTLDGVEPLDVAVDGDDLWIATAAGLLRWDLKSRVLRSHLVNATSNAVTLSKEYGLYVTVDPYDGLPGVWRYRYRQASGDPQEEWGGHVLVAGYFDGLEALTIGDDGKAWLLDVPPRAQRLALTGVVEAQIEVPDPVEVDADAAGRVYAAAADKVYAYAADGTERWQARLRAASPGVDVDVVGVGWDEIGQRVVVLDSGSRQLHYFDDSGLLLEDWQLRSSDPSGQYWSDMVVGSTARATRWMRATVRSAAGMT